MYVRVRVLVRLRRLALLTCGVELLNITISEDICRRLAEEIITGVIAPGEKLDEQATAKRYGVSRTPIREAFRQLATTGLIESRPHKGVTVINLDTKQLSDMFEALGEIEALCAKMCAQRMSAIERKQLENIHLSSRPAQENEADIPYSEHNENFHKAIHSGSHNESLTRIAQDLWRSVAPFRRSVFFKQDDRMSASFEEHQRIVTAIINSDAEEAFEAMRTHVTNSSLNAIAYFQSTNNA